MAAAIGWQQRRRAKRWPFPSALAPTQHNPRDEIDVHGIDVVGHSADAVGGLVAVQLSTVVVVVVVVVGFSFVNPNRLASWQSKKKTSQPFLIFL